MPCVPPRTGYAVVRWTVVGWDAVVGWRGCVTFLFVNHICSRDMPPQTCVFATTRTIATSLVERVHMGGTRGPLPFACLFKVSRRRFYIDTAS